MRNSIKILLMIASLNSFGQFEFDKTKISTELNSIIIDISNINLVMGSNIGESSIRPKQYDNFINLKEKATSDELIELTNHPNPIIRSYAFWALSYDQSIDLYPILVNHINDDGIVKTQFGCTIQEKKVGDFFIDLVTPKRIDLNSKKLTIQKRSELDSILINRPNNLYATDNAIIKAKLTEKLYPKIRELVINNNRIALITLAKYQKQEDVKLILDKEKNRSEEKDFFYTYKAIYEFPHIDFLPFIENNLRMILDDDLYSSEWRELYKAIAIYKNDKALDLLRIPFTQVQNKDIREYHIDFIFNALRKHKEPIYNELLWQIWEKENKITPDVYEYLLNLDSKKTFDLTKKNLNNTNKLYDANISFRDEDINSTEHLIEKMLELVENYNKEFCLEVIRNNLNITSTHLFGVFSKRASIMKDESFIEPLFKRLKKKDNSHIYLKAVKALIAYQNIEINQRILLLRKKNKNLRKGWVKNSLDKILKDNNIQ